MAKRKKPEGEELKDWCHRWDLAPHDDKVQLADEYGVSYDTAKHWRSEASQIPKVSAPKLTLLADIEPPPSTIPIELSLPEGIVAIINDPHIPFHDPPVLAAVEEFLFEHKPDVLIYDGDMIDFYQLSKFDKDPGRTKNMQGELDLLEQMLQRHCVKLPDTEKYFIIGTHEKRLKSYLWTKAPELSSLRCLTVPELLGLEDKGITLVDFEQGVIINGIFLVLHGDIVSVHSSYTAKRLFEKHGGCGMAGHTHRIGSYYRRDRFGTWGWWENGCLCSLNPDWIQNPNWIQGFSLVHFIDNRFWVEQIPIIESKFMYGGKLYGA